MTPSRQALSAAFAIQKEQREYDRVSVPLKAQTCAEIIDREMNTPAFEAMREALQAAKRNWTYTSCSSHEYLEQIEAALKLAER